MDSSYGKLLKALPLFLKSSEIHGGLKVWALLSSLVGRRDPMVSVVSGLWMQRCGFEHWLGTLCCVFGRTHYSQSQCLSPVDTGKLLGQLERMLGSNLAI